MSTVLTPNLQFSNILTGTQQTTWWFTSNFDRTLADRAQAGVSTYTLTGDTVLLLNSTTPPPSARVWVFGGAMSAPATVTYAPNTSQNWALVYNNSGQTLTFRQGLGTTLSVPTASYAIVLFDGAGAGAGVTQFAFKFPVGPGSVSAPSYNFAGYPDVGLYAPFAHALGVAANGVRMAQYYNPSGLYGLNTWGIYQ